MINFISGLMRGEREKMVYRIQDFIQLIAGLRDPNGGCPWDLKQNYHTMIPCLLEERYEKIVRRHPHVFGDKSASNEQEALQNWNAMKAAEKQNQQHLSILDNIPHALPALMRAEKLQKRCAKVGFDWDEIMPVVAKIEEELDEVKQEINRPHFMPEKAEEELGDLLFAVVNLSRHLKCGPEEALRKANLKFERRFRAVESKLKQQNKTLEEVPLVEMDLLWNQVKKEEQ